MPVDVPLGGAPTGAIAKPVDPGSREGTIAFWISKGAPQHVAEGIADSVKRESGFKSKAWNPDDKGSPSGGLYQHHATRLAALQANAAMQNKSWEDPMLQHEFAFKEVMGKDPVAAAHWKEILAAPDRASAQTLWDKYFERGEAIGPGGGGGGTRRAVGRFGGMAPPQPVTRAADDDLPDDESRKARDREKIKAARFAAEHATPALFDEAKPVEAAAAPAALPPPVAAPQQQLARAPVPNIPSVGVQRIGANVAPIAVPQAPPMGAGYRDILASILTPKKNPLAGLLG